MWPHENVVRAKNKITALFFFSVVAVTVPPGNVFFPSESVLQNNFARESALLQKMFRGKALRKTLPLRNIFTGANALRKTITNGEMGGLAHGDGGCGGLWRDVVGENGTKCPLFAVPFPAIFPRVEDLPHNSLCKNHPTALTDRKMGTLPLTDTDRHGGWCGCLGKAGSKCKGKHLLCVGVGGCVRACMRQGCRDKKSLCYANRNEHSWGRSLLHGQHMGKTQDHRSGIGSWRRLALGGWWQLAAVGAWRLVTAGGGWQLAVGGPWGLSLRPLTKKGGLLEDTPGMGACVCNAQDFSIGGSTPTSHYMTAVWSGVRCAVWSAVLKPRRWAVPWLIQNLCACVCARVRVSRWQRTRGGGGACAARRGIALAVVLCCSGLAGTAGNRSRGGGTRDMTP